VETVSVAGAQKLGGVGGRARGIAGFFSAMTSSLWVRDFRASWFKTNRTQSYTANLLL